jgi:hypothetical protein
VPRQKLPGSANNIGSQSPSMLITLSDFPDGFDVEGSWIGGAAGRTKLCFGIL